MYKPLITIIITNYNYGHYIPEAIKSVIGQTYPNIELLIINDGSTDNSDEIIKKEINKYKNNNIRYFSRKNKGIVYTRNEGIRLAKGEYISFLDADDYFSRNYIAKSYAVAKKYDVDVVYPNWHFVGDWLGRPDTDFPEFTPKLLQLQKLHVTPASLTRRKAVENREFEVEKVAEDWDFFIGLSLDGGTFKLAKDNTINYRIRKGTRGSKNNPKDDTKEFVKILKKYKKIYGKEVINPSKLVSCRHPGIVRKALNTSLPRKVTSSVKNNGPKETARKILHKTTHEILHKTVYKNKTLVKAVRNNRNRTYEELMKNYKIKTSSKTRLAVIVHLYYPEMWSTIRENLSKIPEPFDLYVTVQHKDSDVVLEPVGKNHRKTNIFSFPNRGRDVLPFLLVTRMISKKQQYEYLLKLHSKKSPHRKDGDKWLQDLMSELLPKNTEKIISILRQKNTGVVGPGSHIVSMKRYMGSNLGLIGYILEKITDKKTIENILYNQEDYPFFGGTMFWCRVDYIAPLINPDIEPADFNTEKGQLDGTTAHAIERVLGKALHLILKKKMYVVKDGVIKELPKKSYNTKYKYAEH